MIAITAPQFCINVAHWVIVGGHLIRLMISYAMV
jgi:hypothetical protein